MSAQQTDEDPQENLEHDSEEMGERLDQLAEHIDESKGKAATRREDADPAVAAGDWEEAEEATRGDDPTAFDDPERLSEEDEV